MTHWLQEKDPNWVILFFDFIMAQFRVKSNGKVILIDADDIGIIDRRHVLKCKSPIQEKYILMPFFV